MEDADSKSIFTNGDEESLFVDASNSFESDHSLCISRPSSIDDININKNNNVTSSIQSKETPESPSSSSSADLFRRQLVSRQSSVVSDPHGSIMSPEKDVKSKSNLNFARILASSSSVRKLLNEDTDANSAITSVNDGGRINDEFITVDSPNSGSNLLFSFAGLLIKVIGFQINLFVSFVTFPIWLIHSSYMFVIDPFRIIRRAKCYTLRNISRIWGFCYRCIKWIIYVWIKKHESTLKFCLQIVWGFLWLVYIWFILVSLLVFAFVLGGIILKCLMEAPIQLIEQLNFDYTKDNPTAFVPIMSCPEPSFLECKEQFRGESRVIPVDHKVQATVSLTLPESYYNRNLGVFQVRVDFLSVNGKPIASTKQPCMLQFKSQPIRLLLTFLNLAPLITGYSSESQTLNIKFKGYTERNVPTSCLRVIMEQRAEFAKGGGVPEIYEASLKLESQPPFLKRILWYWKGTIFVWVSFMIFMMELFFTLLCCTPVIVPWLRPREGSLNDNASRITDYTSPSPK